MPRTVSRVIAAHPTPEGDGMLVHRAFPNQSLGRLDPFLMLDEMGPIDFEPGSRKGFPDHPHRGFETVTYLLEGEFEHRDSRGHAGRLGPGDVQWMTAGSGILHSEMPSKALRQNGGRLRGLQLWVNLPKADKMMAPRYQEIPAATIPEAKLGASSVRVLAGSVAGTSAVIDTRIPIQFLHAKIAANSSVALPVPAGQNGFVYVLGGGGTAGGKAVSAHQLAILGDGDGDVMLDAGGDGMEAILVSGKPIGEPVFQYGPFVMTNREEILQAIEDYNAGKFGTIPRA